MELFDALGQIAHIREQMARTETFRGFRALTVGFSGALGIAAGVVQARRIPRPTEQVFDYVDLWVSVAVVSLLVVGAELAVRGMVFGTPLRRRLTVLAVQQFAPSLAAGAAVTFVIAASAPESAWMLPGLWAVLFSLGIFATCRLLPRATAWVGVHYLICGVLCLSSGSGACALSPWMMAGTFGGGQLLAAAILYHTLERRGPEAES